MILNEQKIKIGELLINYVEAGGSGTPIIFLHNGGGFWQSWYYQLKYFGLTHKVYALDWPGFGESELPNELLSLEFLHSVLVGFIKKINLKDVILIGNCIGGSTALKYTLENHENVSKLIILNICPGELIFPLKFFRQFIPETNNKPNRKKIAKSILKFSFLKTPIQRKFPKILFGKTYDKSTFLFKKYIDKFKKNNQTESRINLLFSVHTYTLSNLIKDKEIPKHLLIWGKENSVTNLATHGYYHRTMLQSERFEIVENSGHLCMYESPEKVNNIIEDYIKL